MTLAGDEPSNARFPVSISYSTSPNEKMSDRRVGLLTLQLFGRHVMQRAENLSLCR